MVGVDIEKGKEEERNGMKKEKKKKGRREERNKERQGEKDSFDQPLLEKNSKDDKECLMNGQFRKRVGQK